MKCRRLFVLVATVAVLLTTTSVATAQRNIKDYVGQQPLLFGRRGINPNMNSLFFGKRGGAESGVSLKDLKVACAMIMPYLEDVDTPVNEEV